MPTIDLGEARRITQEKEQQYGLPPGTLMKIGGIESSFNGNAISPKGAKGYFQFIDSTAKQYGLKDPSNFEESADAAGRYMRDNLAKYGGSIDLSIADYNGGPKAALALSRGKPWPETSDYLAKFHGGTGGGSGGGQGLPALSKQFTTVTDNPLTTAPDSFDVYRANEQQNAQYGGLWNSIGNVPGALSRGFAVDNTVYNWWKEQGISSVDPSFQWTDERSKKYLEGIPQDHWGYIYQSKSDQEANLRRGRMLDTMEKEQELSRMGVVGFGGRLVGSLADLPTLVAFVPGMGGEAFLSSSSRIANAARMGIFNAATNVATDALTAQYRPTFSTDSLYMSAAMGLALGGSIGGSINPGKVAAGRLAEEQAALAKFGQREANAAYRAELTDVAGGSHAIDQAVMDAHLPKGDGNIDTKLATGGVEPVVDPVVARVRDEVATHDQHLRDRMDALVGGEAGAERAFKPKATPEGTIEVPKVPDGVPVFDRTNTVKMPIKGTGQTSAKALLADLKNSSDSMLSGLASRLEAQLGEDVKVTMRRAGTRSYYDAVGHEIHLRSDAPDSVKLHEIAHAVTANRIRYGLANPDSAHGQLVKDLHEVFNEVKAASYGENLGSKSKYYLENLDEFVAGIYSGKGEFIDFLAKTKVADEQAHSFLSKAVDIVRKLLGMGDDEVNALTKALGITDQLIDTPLAVRQKAIYRDGTTKDIHYLMEDHPHVDPDTVTAANKAEIPTVFGWGLGLENRLGGKDAPATVRDLASKLFGTTIGYKDHSVVKANAWDDTTKWAEGWAVEMRKGTYPQFEKWFSQQGRKWNEKGQAFDEFGTQVSNYIRGVEGDFAPEVVKAGEQMRSTLAKVADYINNPLFDEGLVKKGLTEVEVRNPETGATELVGKLEKNPNYLPRKHDINKWNDMATSFGRDAVEGWWARAYQAGRDGISDEAAQKWAKWYVRTVEEAHANRSQDLLEDIMRGTDKEALMASLKSNGGFSDAEAQAVMDGMFPSMSKAGKDSGRMASLKHRNTIDETFSETWTKADGTKVEVSLNDFIHSNAFDVVEPYLRRTAGSIALAKHLDIYKTNQIDEVISDATLNKLGDTFKKPPELAKYRKDLKFAFERIQGLPQEEFTTLNKGLEMWRNFNIVRLMGGAVWNQATELSQVIGSMGWKATLGAVPELKALRRDIATGKAPNDILDHLENTIGGVGSEYVARMEFKASDDWVRNKGDTAFNRKLDALDTGTKKLAKGVLDYTGMTPLTIQQKRVHAVALVNHFVNTAKGAPSSFLTKERLAWMGLGEDDFSKVLKDIDKYTKPKNGEYSKSHSMDFAGWQKDAPETYSKFMTAIHRESRRVIQENDLASMIPLMGTTLGKTVFQFMNFTMHGWNKSLQFAMNHKDWSTLSTVLHGSMFASLAYMGRTLLSAQGMDDSKKAEFLNKRLSAGQIVSNSFGRISQASLLPVAFDTISPVPMFSGMRTTSDLSSLASNPTYQALNGLISMKKLVRNGLSDEYQTTDKDIRTWGKLVPLNNVVPISNLLNSLANDYPHSEKE